MPVRFSATFCALLSLAAPALAIPPETVPGGDPAVRAQDDLFGHANGQWLATTAIPGDRRRYGTFELVREEAEKRVRAILEQAAREGASARDPEARMVGDLYASLTDEATIARHALAPVRRELRRIRAVRDSGGAARAMAGLMRRGVGMPVSAWVSPDDRRPGIYALRWTQGGLGLPDRDYYLKTGPEAAALRREYRDYLADLCRLAGVVHHREAAAAALAFETELARISWPEAERRDPVKVYNPVARDRLVAQYGPFPWEAFASALGMPAGQGAIVGERSYFQALGRLGTRTPAATWRAYFSCRLLDEAAPFLDGRFRDRHQRFKGARVDGLAAAPPRWKKAIETMDWTVGEAVGRRYVAQHFPPAAKEEARRLVANIRAAFREKLETLAWMAPETRREALAKLDRLTVKIGYPDRWRGLGGLRTRRDDPAGNLARVADFLLARDMRDVGRPVDRARWWMAPQIVNAYYDPTQNEIVFPAGILQPPFFDAAASSAFNYGGIGAIIGHEISHGFDDQGRQYDAGGTLRDWWTPADAAAFKARAARLVTQYAAYEPLPGERVNGELTLGENIADLTGVTMAHRAYQLARGAAGADAAGDRRFFLGYARIWRGKSRPEVLHQQLLTDPHAPVEFRTNGAVTNVEAFYQAFGLQTGDRLYREPADRVTIW